MIFASGKAARVRSLNWRDAEARAMLAQPPLPTFSFSLGMLKASETALDDAMLLVRVMGSPRVEGAGLANPGPERGLKTGV